MSLSVYWFLARNMVQRTRRYNRVVWQIGSCLLFLVPADTFYSYSYRLILKPMSLNVCLFVSGKLCLTNMVWTIEKYDFTNWQLRGTYSYSYRLILQPMSLFVYLFLARNMVQRNHTNMIQVGLTNRQLSSLSCAKVSEPSYPYRLIPLMHTSEKR